MRPRLPALDEPSCRSDIPVELLVVLGAPEQFQQRGPVPRQHRPQWRHNGPFSRAGAAANRAGARATGSDNISAFAGEPVQILVECTGLDDLRATRA